MKNDHSEIHKKVCEVNLYKINEEEYGDSYRNHFLEQYKIAIQGVDYTSKWKHIVNNYFLTIHTVLLAAVGLSAAREKISMPELTQQVIPVIGIFMAIAWWSTVRSYNDTLEAKFSILHCIEEHLPLAIYRAEWEVLCASHSNPRRMALIDSTVPSLFFVFYALIFIFVK
jgi:hypothetical protein